MSRPTAPAVPILTFDLEEWFHLLEWDGLPKVEAWGGMESRIEANTDRILGLLSDRRLQATFFALGWVARTYPGLLRKIRDLGHEIGCHSDIHTLVRAQNPGSFRQETAKALDSIAQATGAAVTSYRAPGFSVDGESLWVFESLRELGIELDCSVFPGRHAHGGTETLFPAEPFTIHLGSASIREFPVTLRRLGPAHLAFAGGGYFRLLPYPVIRRMSRESRYTMTYFHPRDFDPGQPRFPALPALRRFKSYAGIAGAFGKLDRFLEDFGGRTLGQAAAAVDWSSAPALDLTAITSG